jgi:NADPH2:quinone reductase
LARALSFAQGACIAVPYATAYRALFQRAHAQTGETVLIHGASGGVGLAAVQLAKRAGLRVYGTAGSEEGSALVLKHGALAVYDHRDKEHYAQLRAQVSGEGFDVILEMLANENLGDDLPLLARGGRVVVIGSRGGVMIQPRDLMVREAAILGVAILKAPAHEYAEIHAQLAVGFEDGSLVPVVGREFELIQAPEAHHWITNKPAGGQLVLRA